MNRRVLFILLQLVLLMTTGFLDVSADGKKVIINVPYRVKNVKHTHTIYKIIPHYHKSKSHSHSHADQESEHYEYYR